MPKPVILNHDGHVDDMLSCMLLWLSPEIELQAIGITNGDCIAEQSYEAMIKIANYLNLEGAEIALSEEEVPNPFPTSWRRESYIMNELPVFRENDLKEPYQRGKGRRIEAAFADCLIHSKAPLTIVANCPMTNLANLFRSQPELRANVAELIAMAGAINIPGNVISESGHDGSAEWNVYADPMAFKALLEVLPNIKLIPLDVTHQIPFTQAFVRRLESQSEKYLASNLAAKLLSLVNSFKDWFADVLTAVAAIHPEIFTFKEMKIDVTVQGKAMGRTRTSLFGGHKVQVATQLDPDKFEEIVLTILRNR